MKRELLMFLLALGLAVPVLAGVQTESPADVLTRGIQQVQEGDLEAAATTLGLAVRGLSGVPAVSKDLARANLYLGMARLGLGDAELAMAAFREACLADADLTLDPRKFSPRVIRAFEAAKEETKSRATPASTPTQIPTPTPTPSPSASPTQPTNALLGDRVDCLVAGRFTALRMQAPQGYKAGGRLYFKSNLSPEAFYTGLERDGSALLGIVPKVNVRGGIREISYFFSVRNGLGGTTETEVQTARVVDQPSLCPAGLRVGEEAALKGALSVLSGKDRTRSFGPRFQVANPVSESSDLVLPIADAFGFQTLQEGLKDSDPAVRSATAQSLEEMAGLIVTAIDQTVVRLRSKEVGDRTQAGLDLARTGRQAVKGTVGALIELVSDKLPETRGSVATILGTLGKALARARAALSKASRDNDKDVRVSATQALTAMGSVVTTISSTLRVAEGKESDVQAAEAMKTARRGIEGALSGESSARE